MSGRTSSTACQGRALVGDVGEHQLPAPAAHLGDRPAEQTEVGQPVVVDLGGDPDLAAAAAEGDGQPRGTGTQEGLRLRGEVDRLGQPCRDARSSTWQRNAQSSRSTSPRLTASSSRARVSASSVPGGPGRWPSSQRARRR